MIIILSPAKTLDFEKKYNCSDYTVPSFLNESEYLISELKNKSETALSKLMGISSKLSALNSSRYKSWSVDFNKSNSRQSIFCFKGGVYVGLDVDSFSKKNLLYSQNYLKIISGLHGVLNPFDLIQPYRLEMGTKLKTKQGSNLYEFWGSKITNYLNKNLESTNSKFLLNLASNEYSSSVNFKRINASILNIKFLDKKNEKYKLISFFAKKARGAMASFVIKNEIKNINQLKEFTGLGYSFDSSQSTNDLLTFIR